MKMLLLAATALIIATSSASAEQRDFPTGEPGAGVIYLDAGPGHPTACVVSIAAGLPQLAISFNLFSNNSFTAMVTSQQPIPHIEPGGSATIKVNMAHVFLKVTNVTTSGGFHMVNLVPVTNTPMKTVYDAIIQIVFNVAQIDVVADDAQLPSITIAAEPGLAASIEACQQYLVEHHH